MLHHYSVRDALKDACKLIAVDPDYEEAVRPEVDHDTKNVAGNLPALDAILAEARTYAVLDLTHHTAAAYADLKARIAQKYLAKVLRKDRP